MRLGFLSPHTLLPKSVSSSRCGSTASPRQLCESPANACRTFEPEGCRWVYKNPRTPLPSTNITTTTTSVSLGSSRNNGVSPTLPRPSVYNGDTLIFLGSCDPSAPLRGPHLRLSSQKLLGTGSDKIRRFLGSDYQFHIRRRKKLLRNGIPIGINFIVDLSPPEEGEEAVDIVEKLWCPDAVRRWKPKGRGAYAEDDDGVVDEPPFQIPTELEKFYTKTWGERQREEEMALTEYEDENVSLEDDSAEFPGATTPIQSTQKKSTSPPPLPPAYSVTRHVGALERVFGILHGVDPLLHSATMWYTVHKVAIELGCAKAVGDYILTWLYFERNVTFIELFTPLAMEIAEELQSEMLFKDCFALSVARKLLENSRDFYPADKDTDTKVMARYQHSIEVGAQSFRARILEKWDDFLQLNWLDNPESVPEMQIINDYLCDSAANPTKYRPLFVSNTKMLKDSILRALRKKLTEIVDGKGSVPSAPPAPPDPLDLESWEMFRSMVFQDSGRDTIVFNRYAWMQIRDIKIQVEGSFLTKQWPPSNQCIYEDWVLAEEQEKTNGRDEMERSRKGKGVASTPVGQGQFFLEVRTRKDFQGFSVAPPKDDDYCVQPLMESPNAGKTNSSNLQPPEYLLEVRGGQPSNTDSTPKRALDSMEASHPTKAESSPSKRQREQLPQVSPTTRSPRRSNIPIWAQARRILPKIAQINRDDDQDDGRSWNSDPYNDPFNEAINASKPPSRPIYPVYPEWLDDGIPPTTETLPTYSSEPSGPHSNEINVTNFSIVRLFSQCERYLSSKATPVCDNARGEWLNFQLLGCLDEREWMVLPVWAGGDIDVLIAGASSVTPAAELMESMGESDGEYSILGSESSGELLDYQSSSEGPAWSCKSSEMGIGWSEFGAESDNDNDDVEDDAKTVVSVGTGDEEGNGEDEEVYDENDFEELDSLYL
ncbi:hypothetical protein BDD12DRAFT_803720 [Trichophaea hybrida]|nr:hypothetical protein BDD12DRAFT_803720 [Trichophaea hybrida]